MLSHSLLQSLVFILTKVTLLLASVPFNPVLLSLHFCEAGNCALKCEDFLLSCEHGEPCRVLAQPQVIHQYPALLQLTVMVLMQE